jgi:uncharacterized protein YndB with AHSA1/START domain
MKTTTNDKKDREISLSRILNAPVELVWEAWTKNPEHIVNWWGPEGFTNTVNTMDVRSGGEWNLVMHEPDGKKYGNKNFFKEIIPYKKLVFDHVSEPKSVTTVEFEDQGEKTLLNWHMIFESAEVFLDVVKKHCAVEGMK